LFHNFHLIGFLVLTNRGATTAEKLKFWNRFSPWHACCLLGYTRPRSPLTSVVVTRMQDLACEFSEIFGADTPGPPQWEGATPSRTYPQHGLWPGAGRKRPDVGTKTLVSLNFSAVVPPLATGSYYAATSAFSTNSRTPPPLLQVYRPLQQIAWPCRPTGEAPTSSQGSPSVSASGILIV